MQHAVRKTDWVDMSKEIGLTDDQMNQWHKLFETRHPDGHEAFLAWLGLPANEIADIRNRYR